MALLDNSNPTEPVVFKRGNRQQSGDKVPRQFLEIVAGSNRKRLPKAAEGSKWPRPSRARTIRSRRECS